MSRLTGILGFSPLGSFTMGGTPPVAGVNTTMALGLTYFSMIQLLSAKSTYMAGWVIGLYKLPTVFNPTRVASDYNTGANLVNFSGYTTQALAPWTAAGLDAQNRVLVTAPLVVWTPTNVLSPCPVAGFYILDGAGQLVGAQENPAGPIVVGGTLQPFSIFPQFLEQAIA